MGRPKKKEVKLDTNSFLSIAQEAYNELVEQRTTAIRQINENKKKVEVEDVHDLVNINKANTDLLKIIDVTIDKKLGLVKLLSQLIFKGDIGEADKSNASLSQEDMELLREVFKDKGK